jgi:hypothetical protein
MLHNLEKPTIRIASIALVAALALAACGGGKSAQSNAASTGAPMSESQREMNALPGHGMAAVPNSVRCGAAKPVWVNLKSGAYHEAGDPYYGRTKQGEYLCPSQAAAQGYHPAGAAHKNHRKSKSMSSDSQDDSSQ